VFLYSRSTSTSATSSASAIAGKSSARIRSEKVVAAASLHFHRAP
jgi:hypothetical protein